MLFRSDTSFPVTYIIHCTISVECAVYLYQVPQIADVEADFQETLKDCREISMEDWKNEKFITKLTGRVLRLIAPLM